MPISKITTKGQVTLPKQIRLLLGLGEGDRVHFYVNKNGKVVIEPLNGDIKNLKGMLAKPKNYVSLKDMDESIRKRAGKL